MCILTQITTETKTDGNYTGELTVVTVESGGLTGKDESKIRMLLVSSKLNRTPSSPT